MSTRISIAGQPLHALLVTIPVGLWVFSLVSDVVFASTGNIFWDATAYFTLGGGMVGALLAAVPGLLDFAGLRDPYARRVATMHLVLNLSILAIQVVNFWLRSLPGENSASLPMSLSVISVTALVVSACLGGHLVHVLGVTQPSHREREPVREDRLHPRT